MPHTTSWFNACCVVATLSLALLTAVIAKSKELQHLSSVMEEKETFATQARALQELLRQNAVELERYKQMVSSPVRAAGGRAGDGTDTTVSSGVSR